MEFATDPLMLVLGSIHLLFGLSGILGNLAIIVVYFANGKLHNVNNRFIASLGLSDLNTSVLAVAFSMFFFIPKSGFLLPYAIIEVLGVLYGFSACSSILIVALIGANRYVYVCRNHVKKKLLLLNIIL